MRDRLHDCQRILDAMVQFEKQQLLLRVPCLAFADIARALEGELLSSDGFKDDAALDRHFPAVLGPVLQFAAPGAFIMQLDSQLGE